MKTTNKPQYPIAVLGAGPVGMAAAAHLIERGFDPLLIEAGNSIGTSFKSFAQVRLFSPWRYNIDKAARRLLEENGWIAPNDDELPTAGQLLEQYLLPLAQTLPIRSRLLLNTKVLAVTRKGYDKVKSRGREHAPFIIRAESEGWPIEIIASGVIDATGNWSSPNPLGANGLPAFGELDFGDRIEYGMPDILGRFRSRYLGKNVLVVGAGHSAAGSLIALSELSAQDPATRIHWVIRGNNIARIFGGGDADGLPARGALGMKLKALVENQQLVLHKDFRISEIFMDSGRLTIRPETRAAGSDDITEIDEIVASTGSRPDLTLNRELRVHLDSWLECVAALAPLIDPNEHSCGTVRPHGHRELSHPERGFYIVGAKSYGRAPNFLMATGYEQVRSIAAAMAGDMVAADDVQLDLPETGVCSSDFAEDGDAGSCCAVPSKPKRPVHSFQPPALDAACGCETSSAPQRARSCCG